MLTEFTATSIDADGDTVDTEFDVTFDSGVELTGTEGSDVLVGDGGDLLGQIFNALGGDDIIIGGDGADTINLAADGDSDVLIYDALSEIGDTVNGFDVGDPAAGGDVVDLTDLLDTATDFTGTTLAE